MPIVMPCGRLTHWSRVRLRYANSRTPEKLFLSITCRFNVFFLFVVQSPDAAQLENLKIKTAFEPILSLYIPYEYLYLQHINNIDESQIVNYCKTLFAYRKANMCSGAFSLSDFHSTFSLRLFYDFMSCKSVFYLITLPLYRKSKFSEKSQNRRDYKAISMRRR